MMRSQELLTKSESCTPTNERFFVSLTGISALILSSAQKPSPPAPLCQPHVALCRCKMRMSGLCKVEMTAF
jgi:hypothetical protein